MGRCRPEVVCSDNGGGGGGRKGGRGAQGGQGLCGQMLAWGSWLRHLKGGAEKGGGEMPAWGDTLRRLLCLS